MPEVEKNWLDRIYFIASENKDIYCLTPLAALLNRQVHVISDLNKEDINDVIFADMPIYVCASRIALDFLQAIRPRNSFVAIGIEHGLAPFKAYTYSEKLLDYDAYFAPTEAWAERLRMLYTAKADRVFVTGYPRLETLTTVCKALRKTKDLLDNQYWPRTLGSTNVLVTLSWGVNPKALDLLPDHSNIIYLVHPADEYLVQTTKLTEARVIVSNPTITSELLAYADLVFGDFSSMTIEADLLGLPVKLFVCRELYRFDCDVGDDFFNAAGEKFLHTPHYAQQIFTNDVISDFSVLIKSLKQTNQYKENVKESIFPDEFRPPKESATGLCISSLNTIAKKIRCGEYQLTNISTADIDLWSRALWFLLSAYKTMLGRTADVEGIQTYMNDFRRNEEPGPLWSLRVLREFAASQEGKTYWENHSQRFALVHSLI